MRYPIDLVNEDDGSVSAYAKDVPGAHTWGDDAADAMTRIVDAIETMLAAIMNDKERIPPPSPARGRPTVSLPALSAAKVGLYQTMRDARVTKTELARRLGWHMPQVDRVLDLRHASRLNQIEAAFRALGRELRIEVRRAA